MHTSESVISIYPALIDCWKEFPNLKPEGKGYGYDYVELNKVLDEVKAILPSHGLAAIQFPESSDAQNIGVTTRVIHTSGEWIEGTIYAAPTSMKGINETQATGATITYLRRYGLLCILGAAGDKDTDGRTNKEPQANNAAIKAAIANLEASENIDVLSSTFSLAWKAFPDTESRRVLTSVKDEMKAKLS